MKVRDLITELEKMPQNAEVLHLWDGESRPINAPTREENKYWETPKGNNYTCSSCENSPCTCDE